MMISKYSAEQLMQQYISDMNAGVKKLWKNFREMDIENVGVQDTIRTNIKEIERQVKKAKTDIQAIQFEE